MTKGEFAVGDGVEALTARFPGTPALVGRAVDECGWLLFFPADLRDECVVSFAFAAFWLDGGHGQRCYALIATGCGVGVSAAQAGEVGGFEASCGTELLTECAVDRGSWHVGQAFAKLRARFAFWEGQW